MYNFKHDFNVAKDLAYTGDPEKQKQAIEILFRMRIEPDPSTYHRASICTLISQCGKHNLTLAFFTLASFLIRLNHFVKVYSLPSGLKLTVSQQETSNKWTARSLPRKLSNCVT
jgi:hypothetical protein